MTVVEVRNLSHSYGDNNALKGVTFDVAKGEIFGLLGPNGGGKTTLFNILSTLFPPVAGSASILGSDIEKDAAAVRRRIGVVFQNPSLDIKLTVTENLVHQGHLYGLSVETLSGGLKRRVELAKGLLHKPELLILDEPSVGLDPGARYDLWQYLEQLRKSENTTILLTTHLIDEAEKCNHVLILHNGEVVATGTPTELKQQIGGDIITLQTTEPDTLQKKISIKFGIEAAILNESLRVEQFNGHEFVTELMESFPEMIDSVKLAKPTLEDVFINRTGHRFWEQT